MRHTSSPRSSEGRPLRGRPGFTTIGVAAGLALASGAVVIGLSGSAAQPDPEKLAAADAITAARSSLGAIEVATRRTVLSGGHPDQVPVVKSWVAANPKAAAGGVELLSGPDGPREGRVRRGLVVDGIRWSWSEGGFGVTKNAELGSTFFPAMESNGIFEMWRYFPMSERIVGAAPAPDLVALLKSDASALRSEPDAVDGTVCRVLDVRDAQGRLTLSLWLDPARGWLPVQQRVFMPATGEILYQLNVTDAATVAPGLWMPTKGVRGVLPAQTRLGGDAYQATERFEVEPLADGALFHTGTQVAASAFEPSAVFPADAVIVDGAAR